MMRCLSDRFKESVKSEIARAIRRIATKDKLTEPPEEKILTVQKYGNTSFVNVHLGRSVYTRLEEVAERVETTPDVLISNATLMMLRKLERTAAKP